MQTSESISELAAALTQAQGEFRNPERNREVQVRSRSGGSYSFRYATFDSIIEMARPILAKHGLSILQPPSINNDQVVITTRLLHSSGQWVEDALAFRPESLGMQQIGSAITYAKRYSYCSLLNIAADEDDDGNGADGNQVTHQSTREPASQQSAPPPSSVAAPPKKPVGNVYLNAQKAIQNATDGEQLNALTDLLGVRWKEKVLTEDQTVELQELINAQRQALANPDVEVFA